MNIVCDFKVHSIYGYGCEVKSIQNPSEAVVKITGNHQDGKNNGDVKYFLAENSEVAKFPEGINECFENLQTLNLNFPKLEKISNENLGEFGENLRNLFIIESQIKYIPENLFKDNPNLVYINIKSSKIESIDNGAFDPLSKLKNLFINFNCYEDEALNREKVQEFIEKMELSCHKPSFRAPIEWKDNSKREKTQCWEQGWFGRQWTKFTSLFG
jgi:hypothetical protein